MYTRKNSARNPLEFFANPNSAQSKKSFSQSAKNSKKHRRASAPEWLEALSIEDVQDLCEFKDEACIRQRKFYAIFDKFEAEQQDIKLVVGEV